LEKDVEHLAPSALTAKPHATWQLDEVNLESMGASLLCGAVEHRASKLNTEVPIPPRSFATVNFVN
jgi:hypothetical protein